MARRVEGKDARNNESPALIHNKGVFCLWLEVGGSLYGAGGRATQEQFAEKARNNQNMFFPGGTDVNAYRQLGL
ncbi:MAG: hypothetical protein OEY61_07410 [Gammaproteobacteria bacterium]|nr:hypothetical protein [Gammaproteobacteria bacterium]